MGRAVPSPGRLHQLTTTAVFRQRSPEHEHAIRQGAATCVGAPGQADLTRYLGTVDSSGFGRLGPSEKAPARLGPPLTSRL